MWADFISGKPIVLLGAGQLGHMALEMWPKEFDRPVLILAESGPAAIRGIPVEHPSRHEPSSIYTYVLSYFMDSATNVNRLFAEHLHQDIVTVYDILTYFDPDVFSNGWQGTPDQYERAMDTAEYFEDLRSKEVFRAAAEWRYRRLLVDDFPLIPAADRYNIPPQPEMHFDYILDGGTYDLSLASCLLAQGFSWDSYIAIEPDPSRGEVLDQTLDELPTAARPKIHVDGRALWKESGIAPFHASGLMSARVASQPREDTVSVETVKLDELLAQYEIAETASCLIKLHVEGAEWPVLGSSRHGLERIGLTRIFVNLSHDEDSFLRIPKLLGSAGYQLKLDAYSLFGEGLTLLGSKH